jgi:hypothetical protein
MKSILENILAGPSGWPQAYHQLQQVIGARGAILFLLLAAALFVWWKWERVKKLPGIQQFVEWLKEIWLPTARVGRLTIALAHLDNDKDRQHEEALLYTLRDFKGVKVQRVNRTIKLPAADDEDEADKIAEEKARGLLRQTRADILIWAAS